MRTRPAVVALLLVALPVVSGCTTGDDGPAAAPTSSATSQAPSAPGSSDVAASAACAQVRAGIDAFNAGDFDETVDRFAAAVPLAEGQADGSDASDDLVEAVRWYADLPAEDYLEASRTSADFQRYKAITLAQCATEPGLPEPEPSDPGVDT